MIRAKPLTAAGFAPFGDVIEAAGAPDKIINQGMCGRHHDLAKVNIAEGRAGISLFDAQPRGFPYQLELVERHPLGSQAFIPINAVPFLVVVATDKDGKPGEIQAFLTGEGQSINLHRNVWHGVLAPIGGQGQYAVVDYVGDAANLQEHWFDEPPLIQAPLNM